MEINEKEKISTKDRLIDFYKTNKKKVYIFLFLIIIILLSVPFAKHKIAQQNANISEKYIQAGLYLSSGNKKKSIAEYENIINSGNKFYSILALNKILEKGLIADDNKILEYFTLVEKNSYLDQQKDLIKLKKALYFIKKGDSEEGKKLLKDLINNNSQLKSLAEEIIIK